MGKKRPPPSGHQAREKRQKRNSDHDTNGPSDSQSIQDRSKTNTGANGFLFSPRPDWHAAELPALPNSERASTLPPATVEALKQHGESLLQQENSRYSETHLKSSSSHKFLSTIMSSGTLEDKVSALTLLVQESPLHTMKAFENLAGLAGKSSRNQALMALSALKDLLGQGVVLPPDRKLRYFAKQPGLMGMSPGKAASWRKGQPLPGRITGAHLISWAYEDWLKRTYFDLLKTLERWCNDEIEYARSRAVTYVWELLKEKPEQEENLLRLLVNKLGDKEKKIASRASYLLLQLQVTHPVMKTVIINAIEAESLFRPGQNAHAKYYAVITLNQTVLSMKEQEVADKLLNIYFALFLSLLKTTSSETGHDNKTVEKVQGGGGKPGRKARQKEKLQEKALEAEIELNDKIVAQVLTGVNRAYPFAATESENFSAQMDTLFRVAHSANFNTAVQAMMLIQQISASKHQSADRFYRMLYESLLDARLLASSKQIMYLNLLYRALKSDVSINRVKAFVKRLLQIITLHEPPFACGVLYLVYELQQTFPSIKGMLEQAEDNIEEEENFKDVDGEVQTGGAQQKAVSESKSAYDSRNRHPEYSNASQTCLWDILPLSAHFHPSVSLFATSLLHSTKMPPKPDPSLFTPMHFLDRFVYRNAKTKTDVSRGTSIMQPLVSSSAADLLIKKRDGSRQEVPMNSESFWQKKLDQVAPDEVFFHQYFQQEHEKQNRQQRRAERRKRKGEDGQGDDDDSMDEGEVWKALVNSRPDLEGADEDDAGFSDVEDLDEDDEDLAELDAAMASGDEAEDGADEAAVSADEQEGMSDDGFDVAGLDDDDAMLDSDEEVANDVPDGTDEVDGKELSKSQKKRKERKKLKQLPVFASAEDYAKLLEGDDDE